MNGEVGVSDNRRVVVIGSGPSGAMAAWELVHRGIPVVMLESGTRLPSGLLVRMMGRNVYRKVAQEGFQHGDRHVSSGDPKTDWYYNLSPGGLSNQWTGAVPRFSETDFTEGARLDERYRWPLSYEDLAPYYAKVEPLMTITAAPHATPQLPMGDAAYRHSLPQDWQPIAVNAKAKGQGLCALPLADGPNWMIARRGTAFNSYNVLVQPLLKKPNFKLITGAHALRVEWNGARRRADSVVYHDAGSGKQERITANAVVVACGPLNSTKLLFDSACPDFPEGLGNCHGVLGSYLHDHPREWWACDLDKPISVLSPAAYLTRRPPDESEPLMATSWTIGMANTRDKYRSLVGLKTCALGVQVFGATVPCEKYFARPDSSKKDIHGLPLLNLCIQYDENVMRNMIDARQGFVDLLGEAGYSATIREIEPQLTPGTSVHYGGTVRMHSDRRYGVLDSFNRVYDIPNLVVADASCFTTGPEKNPNLTAMALAARAASQLADDMARS